jgi:hypothetical protein
MASLFDVLVSRLRAVLLSHAAWDLEAEFLTRTAQRRADLFRQAALYEQEGLTEVAQELRRQASAVGVQSPLSTTTPTPPTTATPCPSRPPLWAGRVRPRTASPRRCRSPSVETTPLANRARVALTGPRRRQRAATEQPRKCRPGLMAKPRRARRRGGGGKRRLSPEPGEPHTCQPTPFRGRGWRACG